MKSILAAATILSALAVTTAHATPINYTFMVTATDGPLSGTSATGTFSYDSSSIIPGGININVGLLTSLDFTWNGIHYDQTTANTGFLEFNSSGNLIPTSSSFGNHCSSNSCEVDSNTEQWFVGSNFTYSTLNSDGIFDGTTTFSLITAAPEPSTLALLGVGIAGAMLMGARAKGTRRATGQEVAVARVR